MHEFNLVKNFFYEDIPKELRSDKHSYIEVKHNISIKDKSNSVVEYDIPVDVNTVECFRFDFLSKDIIKWFIEHGAIIGEKVHITLGNKDNK